MNELLVLIDKEGKLLEIDPKETTDDSILVPLKGYYEILNEHRYPQTRWDFNIKDWVGVGEQRPIKQLSPSTDERIKSLEGMVLGLLDAIMMGGI